MLEATLEIKALHHQDVNSKRIFVEYPFILCYYKNMNSKLVKKILSTISILAVTSSVTYFALIKIYRNNAYPSIKEATVKITNDGVLNIKFKLNENKLKHDKIYCAETNNIETTNKWILAENGECNIKVYENKSYTIYLKNENNKVYKVSNTEKLGNILSMSFNKEKIYLAVKGTYSPTLDIKSVGYFNKEDIKYTINDEEIASIDKDLKITGLKVGNTTLTAEYNGIKTSTEIVVSDLITVRPKKYNSKKPYLPCGKYNEEENDLLDEILKDRVDEVGYQTRASAVEAARFLTLEFPYKIRYFSENGRASTNGIDGEGRYYHKGLYLDESRFTNIKKKMAGPKTWGCQLYSRPSHGNRPNGLDCSGFITWAMLNGGWDVGDIGAGLASHLDLTDYGERIRFNADVVASGKVKVGDLLSSGGLSGGHIAMIAGEDDEYYYVAESLWTPPNVAVIIKPYSKKTIFNRYFYVMLMDSYYKEDGKLTKLWY